MKIVIPTWQGRISPVFDVASHVLIVEVVDGKEKSRAQVSLSTEDPLERAKSLTILGVEILICNRVSKTLEVALASQGIKVHQNISGEIEEVLAAYRDGSLNQYRQ
jgi:predicted Fe-Mo cluster-binding NifX family protein